ncbi:unnamed protein product [Anisakis simplex]|uniref:GLOBIN domain-containing protein n=1 Tax=Anisakis simplex TaxID=6269 RepID=A0A0M3KGC3_ANISI|nr:unnamed protein product [Anisakis simplex]
MLSCLCFNSRRDSVDVVKKQADEQPSQNVNSDSDDPRIPLTMKQKFVLTKNWKGIAREVTEAGANMFVK